MSKKPLLANIMGLSGRDGSVITKDRWAACMAFIKLKSDFPNIDVATSGLCEITLNPEGATSILGKSEHVGTLSS